MKRRSGVISTILLFQLQNPDLPLILFLRVSQNFGGEYWAVEVGIRKSEQKN